jgi:hypothetical protein
VDYGCGKNGAGTNGDQSETCGVFRVSDESLETVMAEVKTRKPRKLKPYTKAWEALANAEARAYVTIRPCRDCGGPVVDHYCCDRCGSGDP